jgi:hypothetical protein
VRADIGDESDSRHEEHGRHAFDTANH